MAVFVFLEDKNMLIAKKKGIFDPKLTNSCLMIENKININIKSLSL